MSIHYSWALAGRGRHGGHGGGAFPAFLDFAWDANDAGEGVTNYKLYSGATSGSYGAPVSMGNVTTYSIAHPGTYRYYAITAENSFGESVFSDELYR